MPLHTSLAPMTTSALVSSQSPSHSLAKSASSSNSAVPVNVGQCGVLQSLLTPSQTSGAPGKTVGLPSSQSPAHSVKPSPSRSTGEQIGLHST